MKHRSFWINIDAQFFPKYIIYSINLNNINWNWAGCKTCKKCTFTEQSCYQLNTEVGLPEVFHVYNNVIDVIWNVIWMRFIYLASCTVQFQKSIECLTFAGYSLHHNVMQERVAGYEPDYKHINRIIYIFAMLSMALVRSQI